MTTAQMGRKNEKGNLDSVHTLIVTIRGGILCLTSPPNGLADLETQKPPAGLIVVAIRDYTSLVTC